MESHAGLHDGESDILPLQLGVRSAKGSNEFRAADLTPDEIVGVIDDLHLVGLGVPHPELDVVSRPGTGMRFHVRVTRRICRRSILCKARTATLT